VTRFRNGAAISLVAVAGLGNVSHPPGLLVASGQ
jgi:hypothetical protein